MSQYAGNVKQIVRKKRFVVVVVNKATGEFGVMGRGNGEAFETKLDASAYKKQLHEQNPELQTYACEIQPRVL